MSLLSNLILIDLAMILPFVLLFFFRPKNPKSIFGYKTARAAASQENWDFAQKYSSRLFLIVLAPILITQTTLFYDLSLIKYVMPISIGQFVLYSIVVIVLTETALKKFEKESKESKS